MKLPIVIPQFAIRNPHFLWRLAIYGILRFNLDLL